MNKKSNHYTLMFIPENNGKTFTLRVHKYIVTSLLTFFVIFMVCLSMLLYKAGVIAAKLQMLYIVRIENEKLVTENKQLRLITEKFDKIESMYTYLSKLANPPPSVHVKAVSDSIITDDEKVNIVELDSFNVSQKSTSNNFMAKDDINSIPNILPVDGWVTRQFLKTNDSSPSYHQGVDYAATLGTPIKATAPGIVEDVRTDPFLGLLITINHENGYTTKYGHCSQVLIAIHDRIKRGQMIALVGNTGRSTAPHLHYELLKDGVNIDPLKYLLTYK
jgi:murein DD-endopeptidase MepM/ murein hydrolase activator NlpD